MNTGERQEGDKAVSGFREKESFGRYFQIKLFLSFAATCGIMLWLAFEIFYGEASKMILHQSGVDTGYQLDQTEAFVDNLHSEAMHMLQLLMLDLEEEQFLNQEITDETKRVRAAQGLFDKMKAIPNNYTYVDSVFYFTKDGMVMGVSSGCQRYVVNGTDPVEYQGASMFEREVYQAVLNDKAQYSWSGGLKRSDFHFYSVEEDTHYLTFMAKINVRYGDPVVMVLNIREDYLSALYEGTDPGSVHERYIVDADGMVVSSPNKNRIGQKAEPEETDAERKENGSPSGLQRNGQQIYTMDRAKGEVQVVSKQLDAAGWSIVNETPVSWLNRDVDALKRYRVIILTVSLLAALLLSRFWIQRITEPLMKLNREMHEMEKGRLGGCLDDQTVKELGVVGRQFNRMSRGIVTLIKENRKVEEEKRFYEIETLRQQINPHFIYNTLNTIRWMAVLSKNENITACVEAFGKLLKPIFRKDQAEYTLNGEIDYIREYITIMNYRYGNRLKFEIHCPKEYQEEKIPRLVLQPILENSILHGMRGDGRPLILRVEVEGTEGMLTIRVSDDGVGLSEETLSLLRKGIDTPDHVTEEEKEKLGRQGIGVSNVSRRIRLLYGERYGLSIESEENTGTWVTIRIPRSREKVPSAEAFGPHMADGADEEQTM